jgi:hypothetical protein
MEMAETMVAATAMGADSHNTEGHMQWAESDSARCC